MLLNKAPTAPYRNGFQSAIRAFTSPERATVFLMEQAHELERGGGKRSAARIALKMVFGGFRALAGQSLSGVPCSLRNKFTNLKGEEKKGSSFEDPF